MASESTSTLAPSSCTSSGSEGEPASGLAAAVFSSLSSLTPLSFMLPATAAQAASPFFSPSSGLFSPSPLYTSSLLPAGSAPQTFSAEQMQALLSSLSASSAGGGRLCFGPCWPVLPASAAHAVPAVDSVPAARHSAGAAVLAAVIRSCGSCATAASQAADVRVVQHSAHGHPVVSAAVLTCGLAHGAVALRLSRHSGQPAWVRH